MNISCSFLGLSRRVSARCGSVSGATRVPNSILLISRFDVVCSFFNLNTFVIAFGVVFLLTFFNMQACLSQYFYSWHRFT